MFYCMVCILMLCTDVIWWRCADRRLRVLRPAALWRTLLGAWVGAMIVYLFLICIFPALVRR